MTTLAEKPTVDEQRAIIEQVITTVTQDGSGEVFAEDVAAIMNGLKLAPQLYAKVAATLEEVCHNRTIAEHFAADPKWAYSKYVWTYGGPRFSGDGEYWENHYRSEAEQGIALLMGLAVLC